MTRLPFSFLMQGAEEYEVADAKARADISLLENKNRKYLFLGDSYALGQPNYVPSWIDRVISNLNLTADDYVRCTEEDIGSAPAFYATSAGHRSWVDSIAIIRNRITESVANSITDIVLAGGYNEISSPNHTDAEILTPMGDFATYCKTAFPNARMWLGFIGYNVVCDSNGATARNDLNKRVWKCYNKGVEYGFTVMQGVDHCIWYMEDTQNDGIHPTEEYYGIIGDAITNNLLGIAYKCAFTHNMNKTVFSNSDFVGANGITSSNFKAVVSRMFNDHGILTFDPMFQFLNVTKPLAGTLVHLGNVNCKLPLSDGLFPLRGIFAIVKMDGTAVELCLARISISTSGSVDFIIDTTLINQISAGASVKIVSSIPNTMFLDFANI